MGRMGQEFWSFFAGAALHNLHNIYIYIYIFFSHWHIAVGALAFNTRLGEPECGGAAAVGSAAQRFNLRLL